METVDVVIVEAGDLLSGDILRSRNEVCHLREGADDDEEGVELGSRVVLRRWQIHEVHGDDRPRALRGWKRLRKAISSGGGTLGDLTVVASTNAVDNIGDESFPVEMTINGGESLLMTEVTESFVDVINEDIANPFEATARVDRDLDIGYAETNAAGGTVLVEKPGGWIQLVYGVRIHDGEGLREESVILIAVPNGIRILVDRDREKFRSFGSVGLLQKLR
jgi:hypothetical protein